MSSYDFLSEQFVTITLFRLAAENLLIEDVDEWMVYHAARNQTSNHEGREIAADVAQALEAFSRAAHRLLQTLQTTQEMSVSPNFSLLTYPTPCP